MLPDGCSADVTASRSLVDSGALSRDHADDVFTARPHATTPCSFDVFRTTVVLLCSAVFVILCPYDFIIDNVMHSRSFLYDCAQ